MGYVIFFVNQDGNDEDAGEGTITSLSEAAERADALAKEHHGATYRVYPEHDGLDAAGCLYAVTFTG